MEDPAHQRYPQRAGIHCRSSSARRAPDAVIATCRIIQVCHLLKFKNFLWLMHTSRDYPAQRPTDWTIERRRCTRSKPRTEYSSTGDSRRRLGPLRHRRARHRYSDPVTDCARLLSRRGRGGYYAASLSFCPSLPVSPDPEPFPVALPLAARLGERPLGSGAGASGVFRKASFFFFSLN